MPFYGLEKCMILVFFSIEMGRENWVMMESITVHKFTLAYCRGYFCLPLSKRGKGHKYLQGIHHWNTEQDSTALLSFKIKYLWIPLHQMMLMRYWIQIFCFCQLFHCSHLLILNFIHVTVKTQLESLIKNQCEIPHSWKNCFRRKKRLPWINQYLQFLIEFNTFHYHLQHLLQSSHFILQCQIYQNPYLEKG